MIKKIVLCFLVCFMMLLSSCQIPQSPEAKLIAQFDEYTANDIADINYFHAYINRISNEVMPGIVLIKKTVRNHLNTIIDTASGTGFIYETNGNTALIVTTFSLVHVEDDTFVVTYEVLDFVNQSYQGTRIDSNEETGLAKLQISANLQTAKLTKLTLSTYEPIPKEPFILISHYRYVRNAILMGLLLEVEDQQYRISIQVDQTSLGAVLVDTHARVFGMITNFDETNPVIIKLNELNTYLFKS